MNSMYMSILFTVLKYNLTTQVMQQHIYINVLVTLQ